MRNSRFKLFMAFTLVLLFILYKWGTNKNKSALVSPHVTNMIAFDHVSSNIWEHEIYIVDVTTKQLYQVTDDRYIDEAPVFSPLGNKLVYLSRRARGADRWDFATNPLRLAIKNIRTGKESYPGKTIDAKIDSIGTVLEKEGFEIVDLREHRGRRRAGWIDTCKIGLLSNVPFSNLSYFPLIYDLCMEKLTPIIDPRRKVPFYLKDILWIPGEDSLCYMVITSREEKSNEGKKFWYIVLFHFRKGIIDTLLRENSRVARFVIDAESQQVFYSIWDKIAQGYFIYRYDRLTHKTTNVTKGLEFILSPDSRHLAYVKEVSKNEDDIFILDLKTHTESRLTKIGGYVGRPSWFMIK